jgi:hypothetical protein
MMYALLNFEDALEQTDGGTERLTFPSLVPRLYC